MLHRRARRHAFGVNSEDRLTAAREPWVIDTDLDTLVTERYCTFWHEGRQESPESWELRLILWYKMTTSISKTGFDQNVYMYVGNVRTLWIRATTQPAPRNHTRKMAFFTRSATKCLHTAKQQTPTWWGGLTNWMIFTRAIIKVGAMLVAYTLFE